ncbi:MAG: translation initiation factor IF-3 [Planctomycetota bacterium]|nr:translation initiation factor IF-3 [Planctomycetota bacterium]
MAKELRRNDRIRISPIRLIDAQGNQAGVVETAKAIEMARQVNLDLVEVAPQADPPVCRIMDFGKYKYDLKKKQHKARAQRHEVEMKEVRIKTPKIGRHDLEIKVNRAREFLNRGDRVQFTLRFRGREMAHQNLGREILNSVKSALEDVAKVERDFRMEGRRLTMVLASTVDQRRINQKNAEKTTASALQTDG